MRDKELTDKDLFPQKELVQKVTSYDISTSQLPNSVLNRQQADRFLDLTRDQSVLLKAVRNVRVDHPSGEINKLEIAGIVVEGASATTSATTSAPDESTVQYDTVKYRAAFNLDSDFLEDNIERERARTTLLNMFTKAIANNTEQAAIEGDSSLSTGDAETRENNLLGVNDGWKKLLTDNVPSGQQINADGKEASKKLFYDLKQAIPNKYRKALPDYRFIVSPSVYDKWQYVISNRATAMGDRAIVGEAPPVFGIPLFMAPLMPEDLTYGTAGTDGTQIWLTPLQNLVYIVQRKITIEWDRRPRYDRWEVTIHFRVDFVVEDYNAVVLAKNVSIGSGTDYS